MSDPRSITMLDEAAVSALGKVRIESWTAEYNLKTDSFTLIVTWQGYGYGQCIPTTSMLTLIAMLEAASRARAAVYYDGQGGSVKWSISPVAV